MVESYPRTEITVYKELGFSDYTDEFQANVKIIRTTRI